MFIAAVKATAATETTATVTDINNKTGAAFTITDTKLYVPVVSQDNNKLLEQLKIGFKRAIRCDRYKSEMTIRLKLTLI